MQILTIEHLEEEDVSHFHLMRWFKQLIYYEYKPFYTAKPFTIEGHLIFFPSIENVILRIGRDAVWGHSCYSQKHIVNL